MLRSLGLFLLLATASLADLVERQVEVVEYFDYSVMYTPHDNCESVVDEWITAQTHQTVHEIAGEAGMRPLQHREEQARRQLRTSVSPRELCTACGCAQQLACRIQFRLCADTCGNYCTCARRLEDDEEPAGETVRTLGADGCGIWNQEAGNLNREEMSNVLSCKLTKVLKEADGLLCLGDAFEAVVNVL